jgi:hypothetical protein
MKVVIDPYGDGLRLTGAAYRWLADRIAMRGGDGAQAPSLLDFCTPDTEHDEVVIQRHRMNLRSDPDLISVLEALGESALGKDCGMRVVDTPDNASWEIVDVAGFEFVRSINTSSH